MTLTSAVYIILANMNEHYLLLNILFCKVVRQEIWGEVVDFIPAFSAVTRKCSSERIIKIGQHLSEKWRQYEADVFLWNTLYYDDMVTTYPTVCSSPNRQVC